MPWQYNRAAPVGEGTGAPEAGEKAGSRATRIGELALPLSTEGTAPCLGSTLELTLLVGVQVKHACGHESRRAAPAASLIWHGMARVKKICPTPLTTCNR